MSFSRYFLVLLLITGSFLGLDAQMLKENELVVIKGEKFVIHQVRTGETLYSISRQYDIDSQSLSEYNPKIADGLRIGDMLKIPFREGVQWQQEDNDQIGDPDYFETYTITLRTETPYFIAREFGITIEQLYAYNPEVSRFRKGTKLRIPRWGYSSENLTEGEDKKQPEQLHEKNLVLYEVKPGENLSSIARKFKISESEILFFNSGARELVPGSVIHLPRPAGTEVQDYSQLEDADDIASVGTGAFFEHTIVSGETLWSLTRKYNVSEFELIRLNPLLESGFPAGVTIKIPFRDTQLNTPEPINEDAFVRHIVSAGETLYGLASKYQLTIPDIRRFNPQLEHRNLVNGETILIPKEVPEEMAEIEPVEEDSLDLEGPKYESDYYEVELPVVIPENCQQEGTGFTVATTYNVALFLPLFIRENETQNKELLEVELPIDTLIVEDTELEIDTIVETAESEEELYNFFRDSESYLQFYEGALIAVDSLQRAGMQVVLHVMDTGRSADSVRKFIYSPGFLETDLIIGPVFPNVQEEVAAIAAKNQIPIISPLSAQSNVMHSNPYYYQVNPSRDFIISKTAELISEEYFNSNFVVVNTTNSGNTPERKVVELVRERLTPSGFWNNHNGMTYKEVNFSREKLAGLRGALSKEKENVVFVTSMHEGDISIILSNLNNLVKDYQITLIGFNRYEQFRSIQEDFYHNLRMQYVAPYWAEYNHPETIRFLKSFRNHFNTDPGNFGMQGYDVTFYFLNALKNYGKHFEECLPYQKVHLAQGNYIFEKQSSFGGYMNQGVSVISYEPDFDVIRKRVVGPLRFAHR